jgi:hypothetical protein
MHTMIRGHEEKTQWVNIDRYSLCDRTGCGGLHARPW